jgi:hypothetical protein
MDVSFVVQWICKIREEKSENDEGSLESTNINKTSKGRFLCIFIRCGPKKEDEVTAYRVCQSEKKKK